ncbi:hypothetical protein N7471_010893 [Penicillium samsonianum]|uniref:uncharacterized protein n=1 Tax=Penicillium samsonianum TaxID=1882272 RepID=UPI002546BBCE|nr:uncharacterized protein N7471_010893 [Penicillium samsonianum]KAJ6123576.1 hypothetical protein N7471_010893 [Penicillium samsonianum]
MHSIHSTIDLPTVTEIEASTDVLSIRTNAIKVVRVKERFAVKIGYAIPPLEAKNMSIVAANSRISVRKVYANFVDPETQKRYIVMDFIPGPDNNPIISGPTKDQEQMNRGIFEKLGQTQSPHYIRLLQEMINRTLKNCTFSKVV